MNQKIHTPTFLAASFFSILGLLLETNYPIRNGDAVFAIIFLFFGLIGFCVTIFRFFKIKKK